MTAPEIVFNPFDPAFGEDPYPHYRKLHEYAPVGTVPGLNIWYLTKFDDCDFMLRDPRTSSDARKSPVYRKLVDDGVLHLPQTATGFTSFLFQDPPDHTRLRKLVSKAFTPRVVERMRPRVEALTEELLDTAAQKGEVEIVTEFAYPLVFTVMSELIGVPAEDQEMFLRLSNAMSASMDPRMSPSEAELARQEEAMREGREYLTWLIQQRRDAPRSDLLSSLISIESEGSRLNTEELMSTSFLLVGAGTETTVHLIGNGLLALHTHPRQLAALLSAPEQLIGPAVEEALRWDPPTQLTRRIAMADLKVPSGATIPEGCPVTLCLAAANRDPDRWDDPDRFDIQRPVQSHLAFSMGIHHCAGSALARIEGQVAIAAFLRRFAGAEVRSAKRRPTFVLRCLDELRLGL
jgi:cytochrome P450